MDATNIGALDLFAIYCKIEAKVGNTEIMYFPIKAKKFH